jgi:DNA invertase Pin-like site-specific DNA recombinase
MRVVAYVRMSTAAQDASPEQQRSAIAAHASKQGYAIAREYADLGVSGDKTDKRHGFRRMIADGSARKFDRIVVYDRSRFGRFDSVEYGRWVQPLRESGVELESVADGVENWDDLGGRITGLVAQEGKHALLLDISRATVRGQTAKAVENRGYPGPTPYGYRRELELRGKSRHSTLSIDPETAPIVREVFETYAKADGSLTNVSAMLNDRGVMPIRGGKQWRRNAVQRILENEVYQGDSVWGRRQKGRYHSRIGSEIVRRKRGDRITFVDPIRHHDAVPAIVSRDLFARVQRLLRERAKATRSPASIKPLSGLVFCACGAPMHSDGENLRCSRSQPVVGRKRCSASRVPAAPFVVAAVEGLVDRLTTRENKARLRAALERRAAARASTTTPDRRELRARLQALEVELQAGLERIPSLPAALVNDYSAMLGRKAAERDRVSSELAVVSAAVPATPKITAKAVVDRLEALVKQAAVGSPATTNEALRSLGLRVVVDRSTMPTLAVFSVTPGDLSQPGQDSVQVPRTPLLEWRARIA